MQNAQSPSPFGGGGGGGGGARGLGTVTAGMAVMNFDEKTKPYTRQDFIEFLMDYEKNLSETELRLVEKGMLGTFVGMPAFFAGGYALSSRFGWHRVMRAMAPLGGDQGINGKWVRRVPTLGRVTFGLAAATIPYMVVQQWFVGKVLDMDERESNLSFHVRRLMLAQRGNMMFKRTATREVTRGEQDRLMREAEGQVNENRSGSRVAQGLATGPMDVNLQLGGQVLTPVAQTGYKEMPKR